jgi:hypothetical protein
MNMDEIHGFKMQHFAIAAIFIGTPHLYYSNIQHGPKGSITLCRRDSKDPMRRPMRFINERSAQAVIEAIVKPRKLAELFEWKAVPLEEGA